MRQYALNHPQTMVFLLYHQPYPLPRPGQTVDDVALENENFLQLNWDEGGIGLPLNLAFVMVDYVITNGLVQIRGMRITGLNRGPPDIQ